MTAAIARIRRIQSQGGPDLRRFLFARCKLKALGHDADDDAFQAIEVRLTANDVGIPCKNALPGAIGNISNHLRSGDIVALRYQPPGDRGYAKCFQQSAAQICRRNANRLRFPGEIRTSGDPRVQRRPGMRIPAQIQEFRSGSPETVETAVWKRRELGIDADKLLRMRVRQRLKEHGVHHREYAGRGANPKH